MEISRKTDYALRMLAELATASGDIISVRAAAARNDVPYSFARSIQHDLAKSGLIESVRGSHGGMRLACDPAKTTLCDIVEAIQGKIVVESCASAGPDGSRCPRMGSCPFNPIWCGADALLVAYLGSVTLAQIVGGTAAPSIPERFTRPDAFAACGKSQDDALE